MNQTLVCLHVFVKRRMQRPCRVCKRCGMPHIIIARSAKYPSVMGTATGCTNSRKNCKAKRRNRQTKLDQFDQIISFIFINYNLVKIGKKYVIPGILG
jgi:hypothetical protein